MVTMIAAGDIEDEEQAAPAVLNTMADCFMFGYCWKTFLPSHAPAVFTLPMKPKSVRFPLDPTTAVHMLPEYLSPDSCGCKNTDDLLFISEEEQDATKLDMEVTVTFFRRLFLLESRPKLADLASLVHSKDVTTLGLEWRIWPDGRFQRRHEMNKVVLEEGRSSDMWNMYPLSLSRNCKTVSSISEQLAQRRAERLVQELEESESNVKPHQKTATNIRHHLGRWMEGLTTFHGSTTNSSLLYYCGKQSRVSNE